MSLPEISLYNSLTKKIDIVTPIQPGHIGMYHCGPTVYDDVHIGNLRAFLLGDLLRRLFEYHGYTTQQVLNITDVGHLISDGDSGDDKMTKALRREGKPVTVANMLKLARHYEKRFIDDLQSLNIITPHHMPRASEHIAEDIAIIATLTERGLTYETDSSVYFSTQEFPDYGALGLSPLDENKSRTGVAEDKRHPRDFALWKKNQDMGWPSPWGQGFPGWHIECSGMSMKYLGENFDLHTGGIDLLPTHHNNEIAQSTCSTGKPLANYWIHNEHVNFGHEKMSKSLGNIQTLHSLKQAGFDPLDYRYWLLQTHYRTKANFSIESLRAARTARLRLSEKAEGHPTDPDPEFMERFSQEIRNDLGTAGGLAIAWEVAKSDLSAGVCSATLRKFDELLGLSLGTLTVIPEHIQKLAEKRDQARQSQDWQSADEARDAILAAGYQVRDTNDGTEVLPS